ncbi:MqnA/MqnD/SBP family protein [Turneriella parva]|uniref:1,4-dihydroxy-6-naphthoate synthase n=1 Tax=Turneriella parva (strain ATCC BAA-1111 / DSM 21527 / NCTC 11395 / H) TaxID=869212 RepID=I4B8E4_TURPD|nr:MqnA/MqnD/SBP family protein [Turneriella parva]AFM13551.1 1,4-dihydroxy-6-naphthoate synthase [Turneriella parva DSM 21527]
MAEPLDIAISPCPNDTFAFFGFKDNPHYRLHFLDIEELNRALIARRYAIAKGSFALMHKLAPDYDFAARGAAIGRGVGPVLVGNMHANARVALPGENTTANRLFRFWRERHPHLAQLEIMQMPFFEMLPALKAGRADAAVLIHEGRFVYAAAGLQLIEDLGAYFEKHMHVMIPLGCIYVRKDLPTATQQQFSEDLRISLESSLTHYRGRTAHYLGEILPFMQHHAQEHSVNVVEAHVDTYVTADTLELSAEARTSITAFAQLISSP